MCYGLPVEFDRKLDGLRAVAQALGRGDVIHAQITTLHLRIPDPPAVGKSVQTPDEIIDLARQLRASDLLKGGVGPREASALAGRKSGQHRWRICSRWRGIRVFRGWRA
jgi:hypothetical protein